jgi:hypothetical protein
MASPGGWRSFRLRYSYSRKEHALLNFEPLAHSKARYARIVLSEAVCNGRLCLRGDDLRFAAASSFAGPLVPEAGSTNVCSRGGSFEIGVAQYSGRRLRPPSTVRRMAVYSVTPWVGESTAQRPTRSARPIPNSKHLESVLSDMSSNPISVFVSSSTD